MDNQEIYKEHIQASLKRCKEAGKELLVMSQGMTSYNMGQHRGMEGLGPLPGKGTPRGSFQHHVLAMSEQGSFLGLLHQYNWVKQGLNDFKSESGNWYQGLELVNQHAQTLDKSIVLVQDLEEALFAFFTAARAPRVDLLVRVLQPEKVELSANGGASLLAKVIESLPLQTDAEVEVLRHRRKVKLRMQVGAMEVRLLSDGAQDKREEALPLSLVVAREVEAHTLEGESIFEAQQAAVWVLLSTQPVGQPEDVLRLLRCYSHHWRVEQLHYVLKGDFGIDKQEFDDVESFFEELAYYAVLAWRTLYLSDETRRDPEQAANVFFDAAELQILQAKAGKGIKKLGEAIKNLGLLVNFKSTKKQPLPGPKTMGYALRKLAIMADTFGLLAQLYNK